MHSLELVIRVLEVVDHLLAESRWKVGPTLRIVSKFLGRLATMVRVFLKRGDTPKGVVEQFWDEDSPRV